MFILGFSIGKILETLGLGMLVTVSALLLILIIIITKIKKKVLDVIFGKKALTVKLPEKGGISASFTVQRKGKKKGGNK